MERGNVRPTASDIGQWAPRRVERAALRCRALLFRGWHGADPALPHDRHGRTAAAHPAGCRLSGIDRRLFGADRPVDPPRGLHPLGADGHRLPDRPHPAHRQPRSGREQGRTGNSLLLHLPLSGVRRWRAMVGGCSARPALAPILRERPADRHAVKRTEMTRATCWTALLTPRVAESRSGRSLWTAFRTGKRFARFLGSALKLRPVLGRRRATLAEIGLGGRPY